MEKNLEKKTGMLAFKEYPLLDEWPVPPRLKPGACEKS